MVGNTSRLEILDRIPGSMAVHPRDNDGLQSWDLYSSSREFRLGSVYQ